MQIQSNTTYRNLIKYDINGGSIDLTASVGRHLGKIVPVNLPDS